MIRKNKSTLILTSAVLLLPMVIGLLLWNRLPDMIPFHWNLNGEIDSWSSKPVAVFGPSAMLLGFHWLCVFVSSADPRHHNYPAGMLGLVLWICPVIGLVMYTLVYSTALGYSLRVEIIMPLLVGLMFIVIGNLLPKCRQSYTLGIKLPWTLASEENWNKTHRLGGKIWVAGGILTMATAFLGSFSLLIAILIVMVLIPTIYSYRYYVKYEREQ